MARNERSLAMNERSLAMAVGAHTDTSIPPRHATAPAAVPIAATGTAARVTRALLLCGVVAGPLYVVAGVLQMLIRPGFDPTRHDLSLLSNGALDWMQIANFLVSGLLVVAGAVGMRRALRGSRGGSWGPLLLGVYGVGLIGAGFFAADPAHGFPPGTPADAHAISWHGVLHLVSGGIGFLALITACGVFARRFAARGHRGWAVYSVATGVLFGAAFVGIATGSNGAGDILTVVTLAFSGAVVLGWAWVSLLAATLLSMRPDGSGASGAQPYIVDPSQETRSTSTRKDA